MKINDLDIESIKRLTVKSGDVLIVRLGYWPPQDALKNFQETLRGALDEAKITTPMWVLGPDCSIEILGREDLADQLGIKIVTIPSKHAYFNSPPT